MIKGVTTVVDVKINQTIQNKTQSLLDSGADVSIIKFSELKGDTPCVKNLKLSINGLSNEKLQTLGYCHVDLSINNINYPVIFHIVEDSFPIPYAGILGNDILTQLKTKIDNDNNLLHFRNGSIPLTRFEKNLTANETIIKENTNSQMFIAGARTETVIKVKILNSQIKAGIIEPIEINEGLYLSSSCVKVDHNNFALTTILNTTDTLFEIPILEVKLSPITDETLHILNIESLPSRN